MYGFMCVAATAALWDNFATYLALPVSTTHTTGATAFVSLIHEHAPCLSAGHCS